MSLKVNFILVTLLLHFLGGRNCDAASLSYSVERADEAIVVRVENLSFTEIRTLQVEMNDGQGESSMQSVESLAAGRSHRFEFEWQGGGQLSDEPRIVRVRYMNGEEVFDFVDVVEFGTFAEEQLGQSVIEVPQEFVVKSDELLRIPHRLGVRVEPICPEKIATDVVQQSGSETVFIFSGLRSEVTLPVTLHFLCYEGDEYLGHASVRAISGPAGGFLRWLSAPVFGVTAVLAFGFAWVCFYLVESNRSGQCQRLCISVARWSFTLGIFSMIFFGMDSLWIVPDRLLGYVYPLVGSEHMLIQGVGTAGAHLLEWLYFKDANVILFRKYFAGPMFLFLLTANFFVIHFLQRPTPATDKNWHLLRTTYSMLPGVVRYDGRIVWSVLSKTGLLAFCVKIFFIPLLVTWAITNLYILIDGAVNWSGDFYAITGFIVIAFIYVDVVVFTVGYLVELPQLGNSIRSVEPSLFGWVVCLMCYPPFNKFSFEYFGTLEWSELPARDGGLAIIVTIVALLLWAVYLSATIALGWKASNLTNRGIVCRGPYKYVRHPAYAAKVAAWALGACFLGERALMVIVALCVVYVLRALTEERHLSTDSDYITYKEKVRWRFIPGVI
jgi:protein-S-isoprenylcysteine O-methyltransferase Ste14